MVNLAEMSTKSRSKNRKPRDVELLMLRSLSHENNLGITAKDTQLVNKNNTPERPINTEVTVHGIID